MNFNKIYFLKNFSTDEIESFAEDDERATPEYLKAKNENGFNIYISVNTFLWNKRKNDELAEIQACFIDLDFPEIKSFWYDEEWIKKRVSFLWEKYRNEIIPKLREIKEKYNITPSQVNVTYKGLHILFDYDNDCYFITPEIHQNINTILNEILGGDENARDLARVYKVVWFIDWKNWKKGKIKSLESSKIITNISKEVIENNFKLQFKQRDLKQIEKDKEKAKKNEINENKRQDRKKVNIDKINSIDSLEIINKLKVFFLKEDIKNNFSPEILEKIQNKLKYKQESSNRFKFYEEDGLILTSGLYLVKNKTHHEIEDYSKHSRQTNYNFIKNWILKDTNTDFKTFNSIIYFVAGITLNTKDEKKAIIDKKIYLDFIYSRLIFPNNTTRSKLQQEVKENNKKIYNLTDKINYKEWFSKIFLWFFHYLYTNLDNTFYYKEDNSYYFEVNEILKQSFQITSKSSLEHNKKIFFQIIDIISKIKLDINSKEVNIFSQIIKTKKSNKDILIIKPYSNNIKFKFSDILFFNKEILHFQKGFKNTKITDLLIYITWILETSSNNVTLSLEQVYEFLGYKTQNEKGKKQGLQKFLKEAKNLSIIKNFQIDKTNIIFSKYKEIKNNKLKKEY